MRIKFSKIKNLLLAVSLLVLLLLSVWGMGREDDREQRGEAAPFCLYYKQAGVGQRIKGFWSEGILYFCMPGYMQTEDAVLETGRRQRLVFAAGNGDGAGDRRLEFGGGDTLAGIACGQVYRVRSGEDGEGTDIPVMFLRGSAIPTIRLATASGTMDYIYKQKGNFESGYMQVIDAAGRTECLAGMDRLSGRGNTSWDGEKKSFAIKLDRAEDVLGMGAAKSWVLYSNYYDGAYIRNQLGFELAQAGGIAYSGEARFAELYINDEYMGLYQIMEKVQAGKNRVEIGDNYLLEIDYRERAAEEEDYIMLSNDQPIVIHAPAKDRDVEGVQLFFDRFGSRMEAGDVPVDQMDLTSFAKMFIMEDILQDMDFGYTSHFMSLDLERGILSDGPVWDMDNTLGRGLGKEAKPLYPVAFDLNYNNLSRWYARLYGREEFRRMVSREYREHFRPLLEQMAGGGAGERVQAIRESIVMDQKRFTGERSVFMGTASLEEHVCYLENYLADKLEVMDASYTQAAAENWEGISFPALERQESSFDEEVQGMGEEEGAGIPGIRGYVLRLRFPFFLLVMCIGGMILWKKSKDYML